jgi:hypothetical protein
MFWLVAESRPSSRSEFMSASDASYPQQLSTLGMTYTRVVQLRCAEWVYAKQLSVGQRHRIVISRPPIIRANPMAKFQLPRLAMKGMLVPAM